MRSLVRSLLTLLAVPVLVTGCQAAHASPTLVPAADMQARSATVKLDSPEALLDYFAAHPEQVALAAYPVGRPEAGIYHRADALQPLASTVKILVLSEYARQVAEGRLDPAARVALDDVFGHVVGRDGGAAMNAYEDWKKRGVLDAQNRLPLDEVAQAMIRFSCNASTDYVIERLGRKDVQAIPTRLGLRHDEAPFSLTGSTLLVSNHTFKDTVAERRTRLAAMTRRAIADESFTWNQRLRTEPGFQDAEIKWLQSGGGDLPIQDQLFMYRVADPHGTTRGYAKVMADLHTSMPASAAGVMKRHLSWPMADEGNRKAFDAFATKGGSLPGILTGASFVKLKKRPEPMAIALFLQDLPAPVYESLSDSYMQQDFEFKLHADPAFFERVKTRLSKR